MRPLDSCPRCRGTLLFDEWGALRCLLCCREQPGGQDRDTGLAAYASPRDIRSYGRRHTYGPPTVSLVSEEFESGA